MPSVAERHTFLSPPHQLRAKRRPVCVEHWPSARRREYNMQQPLLRLCPDVLEHIFLLGAQSEATNIRALRRTITIYSHTCRQWRLVALSVKPLWAALVDFDRNSLVWNTEMLRRSHPLPLTQQISFAPRPAQHRLADTAPLRRKLGMQLDYLDRLQHFSLSCPDVLWDFLVARMCSDSAPQLQSLQVVYHPSPVLQGHTLPVCLPSSLFAGHAPQLRKLSLTECMVDFNAPVFRHLTMLHIVDLSLADAPTAGEWLGYLAMMPDLQALTLEGAIASERNRRSSTSSSMQSMSSHHNQQADDDTYWEGVCLPMISDMMLDAHVEDIATLLEALPMPSPCRWSVLCAHSRPGRAVNAVLAVYNRGMAACYPFSDSPPQSPPRTPPTSPGADVGIDSSSICPLALAANSTDIYVVSQKRHPTDSRKSIILYADLHCTDEGADGIAALFPEVVAGLSGVAPTEMSTASTNSSSSRTNNRTSTSTSTIMRATSLEVNLPPEVLALPSFRGLMCAARRVHTLVRLSGSMTRTLLPVISPEDVQQMTPLPALTHIVFVDDDSMWRGAYDVFLAFVAARGRAGTPLKDVYFLDCCVLEDRVKELKEAGIEVEGGMGAKRWWNL